MGRRFARIVCGVVASFLLSGPDLLSQPAPQFVVGHLGAGYAGPHKAVEELFDPGWSLYGGVTLHPAPMGRFGVRLELGGSWFEATEQVVESDSYPRILQVEGGHSLVTSLSVSLQLELGGASRVGGYFLGGVGVINRSSTVTGTVVLGDISCDPIFPICIIYGQGDSFDDSDRLTKMGYNVGAGLTIAVQSSGQIYLEVQYRRMQGDEGTEFVPMVLGYRW